jgi:hypothetical protein
MNLNMSTSTFAAPVGFGLRRASAGRRTIPALAQRQRLPKLALSDRSVARPAAPSPSAGRPVLLSPHASTAEQAVLLLAALTAGAALAEAGGLMARLAAQWDAFTDLVARLIA